MLEAYPGGCQGGTGVNAKSVCGNGLSNFRRLSLLTICRSRRLTTKDDGRSRTTADLLVERGRESDSLRCRRAGKNDRRYVLISPGGRMIARMLMVSIALLIPGGPTVAAEWPQFRGAGGRGVTEETDLPHTWDAETNIVWKSELPGPGSSSPIVVGSKVFLTCYSGYGLTKEQPGNEDDLKLQVVCLDRDTGKIQWSKVVSPAQPEVSFRSYLTLHGYASSTPVSDGNRVYVFFGKSGVHAFDLDGEPLWRASAGSSTHGFGTAASPILYKDLLIVSASIESESLVAFNKNDGKQVWAAKGIYGGYGTPLLVSLPDGRSEVVVSDGGQMGAGGGSVRAYDPQTGELRWTCQGLKSPNPYVCASLIAHEGIVYAVGGHTTMAIRAGGKGDVTESHLIWTMKGGSKVSSPVYHQGHLYWTDREGILTCVTADKGTQIYSRSRLDPQSGPIYASALLGDGKLYFVSRDMGTYVVEANPQLNQLAHNRIKDDASVFNGSMAVSDRRLLLRSDRYLYCIGKKK